MNHAGPIPGAPDPAAIAALFQVDGFVETVEPFGSGLINDTFLVAAGAHRYVLQRINERVFPQPERIMGNIALLSRHLAGRERGALRIPALVPSSDGAPFVRNGDGGFWRLMEFIPDAVVFGGIETSAQAMEVGRALGRFHRLVQDLDPTRLAVTLPGFHHTPGYLERFERVLSSAALQADEIRDSTAFVLARRGLAGVLETARGEGRLPVRVIHGDPKLDNILFDRATGRAVSLIDLDTVQPGLIQHDVGDCLRSCCNRQGESPGEKAGISFDLTVCREILGTYADEVRSFFTAADIESLYDGIRVIPFELGLRFLTDHLKGDRYFRVTEPGQNLRKARVQFALVEDIERRGPQIRSIIAECFPHRSS
ncbi:MAG: aminoglycoside phosphotransferase family protein [Pseudomonadota bacterium]|nr:aminoglycoside phosphotransferase family protein [Pseudomonadota bacterium]